MGRFRTTTVLCGALAVLAGSTGPHGAHASALLPPTTNTTTTDVYNTTGYINDLFDSSMSYLDQIYDPAAGYLWFTYYPFAAGKHDTRSSVWYAAGLLRRNAGQGGDVDAAVKILTAVIGDQKKNVSEQWFGDYTKYPEEPTVGAAWYPESVSPLLLINCIYPQCQLLITVIYTQIYNSWDPNWRGFISTALIVIYEEYGHLLPAHTRALILESMRNATLGDSYRVGGVDGDNLYPAYSNPALMRAVSTGWTGRQLNDSNMTAAGEAYAREVLDLFDRHGTLSEFNSPTYCGVSLYALTLWAKYLPASSSLMGAHGPRMVAGVWESVGQLYHAGLRNVAGPWDRTYGFDMNLYVGILNVYVWSLVGLDRAPSLQAVAPGGRTPYWAMTHSDDFEFAPLLAAVLPYHHTLVPPAARQSLLRFPGEHTYTATAYAPPYDRAARNVTTWLGDDMTIGAESFDQSVVGGFSINPSAWSPAVAQWRRGDESVGWFKWHSTEAAMDVDVRAGYLGLAYPRGNASSVFTLLVVSNPIGQARDIRGWDDVWGVSVNVTGTVDLTPAISFCGLRGGSCEPINEWEFWNFTYSMPPGSTEAPSIVFDISVDS